MDKVKLNEEQINHLKEFIKTKGFHDHAVILEILDHFACKIEDIMTNEPKMSFYDAITKARLSFGVMGFQPISSAFEKQSRKKYRNVYFSNFIKTVSSIKYIPLLLLVGYAIYTFWIFCEKNNYKHFIEINDCSLFIALFLLTAFAVKLMMSPGRTFRQKSYFFKLASSMVSFLPFFIYIAGPNRLLFSDTHVHSLRPAAVTLAVFFVYIAIHIIAEYKTLKKAIEDDKEIERFYKTA